MSPNHPVQASYRDLLAWAGTFMERHEATITIMVDLGNVKKSVRAYGGGKAGAAALMRQRMSTLEGQLEAAGLVVKIERVFGIPFISSLSTNPAAGTSVRRGSTVTLYVV